MPPRPQDVQARAASVRRVLSYIESTPNPLLMLAPEGRDNLDGGSLAYPPAGVGRFLLLLADHHLEILPAAGWESAGALQVRFGLGFKLSLPGRLRSRERDHLATDIVMRRIAALLPEHLQGEFAAPLD
jgi:hypothetical protein